MLIKMYPQSPSQKHLRRIVTVLEEGGLVVFPTDTVYAIGCSLDKPKALEKLARLKGADPKRPELSFIFSDLSHVADYTPPLDKTIFKLLKHTCPDLLPLSFRQTARYPSFLKGKKRPLASGSPIVRSPVSW